ncbi:RHS repeat protein, partial [Actinoplanes sp. NPDC051633]
MLHNQGYKWNLDHVVDPRGNTMSYWYERERNAYGLDLGRQTVSYDRGGVLKRADFGTRLGAELTGTAPARVVFASAPRCAPGKNCGLENRDSYPDVPFDQKCSANCAAQTAPSFWSTRRLASITTYAGAAEVDRWSFAHSFPPTGDSSAGAGPALWLDRIDHAGLVGGELKMPPVTFRGLPYENRVNSAADGLPPLGKYRLTAIDNEYGGVVSVNYLPPDCPAGARPAPKGNKLRCFPVYWQPTGGQSLTDWMHKYVVGSVTQVDRVGGAPAEVVAYDYQDGGAWHYTDDDLILPERRTWSEWRGYGKVVMRHGSGTVKSVAEYRYFRGMNGDGGVPASVADSRGGSAPDDDHLAGQLRERTVYNGTSVVSTTITDYRARQTGGTGNLTAHQVDVGGVREWTALDGGKWRTTHVTRAYDDATGLLTAVDDRGDTDITGDEECTRTWYEGSRPVRTETVAVGCSATAVYPRDLVAHTRTAYDGAGNPKQAEQVGDYVGGSPVWTVTNRATFDAYGRPRETWDALNRKTTHTYTETGGLTTRMAVTNELGHTTTTDLAPQWGEPVATTDANGRTTTVRYDGLGRALGVWLPGRSEAGGDGPNLRYRYFIRADGASAVATESLRANGNYLGSYAIYDGFMRPRQTQSPGWGTGGKVEGRVITDTVYDSRGLVVKTNDAYYAEGATGTTLVAAGDNNVPSQNRTVYDGAGRPVTSTLMSFNQEKWHSTVRYHGDFVDRVPPR